MLPRILIVLFSLFLISCSQFATLTIPERTSVSTDAVGKFCLQNGLKEHEKPWIRSDNRWANSPENVLLRSWEGLYEGSNITLVELMRSGDYILVVHIKWGKESPIAAVNDLKGRLYEAGIKHDIIIDTQNFWPMS